MIRRIVAAHFALCVLILLVCVTVLVLVAMGGR
jgi:hypothetical protein